MADDQTPAPPLDDGSSRGGGRLWLAASFGGFGFALGDIAGLAVTSGMGQTLLTSLFTFVGGVLLTFAGFRYRGGKGGDSPAVDPTRLGPALLCFALALTMGIHTGIRIRTGRWVQAQASEPPDLRYLREGDPAPADPGPSASNPRPPFGLQADRVKACDVMRGTLDIEVHHSSSPGLAARFDEFLHECVLSR